jgi:hypothetical protein
MTAIHRYEIPVDDQWHIHKLSDGGILHIAARNPEIVEFWAVHNPASQQRPRRFRIYGTGQPLPDGPFTWHGTTITANGHLVWHLIEELN